MKAIKMTGFVPVVDQVIWWRADVWQSGPVPARRRRSGPAFDDR
jgi:hypothetical protein